MKQTKCIRYWKMAIFIYYIKILLLISSPNRSLLKQNISYKKAFDFYTGPHPTEDCTTYLQAYIQSDYNVVNIVKLKTKTKEEKPNSICS